MIPGHYGTIVNNYTANYICSFPSNDLFYKILTGFHNGSNGTLKVSGVINTSFLQFVNYRYLWKCFKNKYQFDKVI